MSSTSISVRTNDCRAIQEDRSAPDLGDNHSGSGETNPPRASAGVIVFNAVAKKIMDESGIPIDDLYTLVKPRLEELQLPANVHFNKDGYGVLAHQAAQSILKALESR